MINYKPLVIFSLIIMSTLKFKTYHKGSDKSVHPSLPTLTKYGSK